MLKLICFLSCMILSRSFAVAQTVSNPELKNQLDSVLQWDQKYREILSNGGADSLKIDSMAKLFDMPPGKVMGALWRLQNAIDSSNLVFIEKVMDKYGYPGKSLVGNPANEVAWNIIQHSPKIDDYLKAVRKASASGELPFKLYAMMYDRCLVQHKKPQVYGSQVSMIHLKNGTQDWYVWPVKDPGKVNSLRKKAGFDQTVEDNAKGLGVDYKLIKMEEIIQ